MGTATVIILVAVVVAALFFFGMPMQPLTLVTVNTESIPTYHSPLSDYQCNVTVNAVSVKSTIFNSFNGVVVANNTRTVQRMGAFIALLQRLFNFTFYRNVLITNQAGEIVYNRTITASDFGDKTIQFYCDTSKAPPNSQLTVTVTVHLELSYEWVGGNFTFSKDVHKTALVTISPTGTAPDVAAN